MNEIKMNNLIEWCNENSGFLTGVLSILTLIVSIIAVIVAIQSARLPYKKKVIVETGHYISDVGYGIHVTATNVGNRDVVLTIVCITIGDQTCVNPNTFMESKVTLKCGEVTSQYYTAEMLRDAITRLKADDKDRVYGVVKDTEGKEYKNKIGTLKELKKHISYQ